MWRLTLRPARRAASRLPPIATVRRPNVVRFSSSQPSTATIAKIQIRIGMPRMFDRKTSRNPCSFTISVRLPETISASPLAATSMARVAMKATTFP